MSSNLPLVRRTRRVLPWSWGLKLEINIPSQRIRAKWKGGLINEGGVISSEYGTTKPGGRCCTCSAVRSLVSRLLPMLFGMGRSLDMRLAVRVVQAVLE